MNRSILTLVSVLIFGSAIYAAGSGLTPDLPPPVAAPVPPIVGAPPSGPLPAIPKKATEGLVTNLRCWATQWPNTGTAVRYFNNENLAIPEATSVRFERTVDDMKFYFYYTNKSTMGQAVFSMTITDLKTGFSAEATHEDRVFHANGNMNVRMMKVDSANPTTKSGVLFGCAQENPNVERPGWIN